MFLLRESMWWLLATACIGYIIGYFKGIPRWGFLLGLFFGPIGWGLTVMIPAQGKFSPHGRRPRASGQHGFENENEIPTGRACTRCGTPVGRADKACPKCGNILLPIRYKVDGAGEEPD